MTSHDKVILIYATFPDLAAAETVGALLVETGLAACVNMLPGMVSIYRWQGRVQRDEEVSMLVKTRADVEAQVTAEIIRLHPYDTPAVLVLPVSGGAPEFLSWVQRQCDAGERPTARDEP